MEFVLCCIPFWKKEVLMFEEIFSDSPFQVQIGKIIILIINYINVISKSKFSRRYSI